MPEDKLLEDHVVTVRKDLCFGMPLRFTSTLSFAAILSPRYTVTLAKLWFNSAQVPVIELLDAHSPQLSVFGHTFSCVFPFDKLLHLPNKELQLHFEFVGLCHLLHLDGHSFC